MAPRRILVRAPNWVGDAVMATPALRALRRAHPDAEITLEGTAGVGSLLRGLPSFDHFMADAGRGLAGLRERRRRLRAGAFDWAVLLPDSPRASCSPQDSRASRARRPRRPRWCG